jgi:hypothetical protein
MWRSEHYALRSGKIPVANRYPEEAFEADQAAADLGAPWTGRELFTSPVLPIPRWRVWGV